MRKFSIFFSTLVLAAMLLAACGGGAISTNVAGSPPPVTADATDDMLGTATKSPTEEGTATETPGVPVTGDVNPARLSNQLDFTVWSQDGKQIGEVEDMVLDLDNTSVAYVIVGTGGFLEIGEREILVPWDSLELQTGTGDTTGGQQNAFILQSDLDTFSNAPDFDLNANLPEAGQPAGDWDIDIRNYWEGVGAGGTANTPSADGTAVPEVTATITGEGEATATGVPIEVTATAGTEPGTGDDQGQALQGVILASEVLGSTVTLGTQGEGFGQEPATAAPEATANPEVTATVGTEGTDQATATAGTDQSIETGDMTVTVDDLIIDPDAGEILYIVVHTTFDDGERWIPVLLGSFRWSAGDGALILHGDAAMLQNAPSFPDGQYPDTTTAGWNSEFDMFWQSNSAGAGSSEGSGAEATPTP
jgi:sporulation protein YlmC with PRC-barrel domain